MKKILFITILSLIGQFCLAMNNKEPLKVRPKRKIFYDFLGIEQQEKKPKTVHNFLGVKKKPKTVYDFLKIEYYLAVELPHKEKFEPQHEKFYDFQFYDFLRVGQKRKTVQNFLEVKPQYKKFKVIHNFLGVEQDK